MDPPPPTYIKKKKNIGRVWGGYLIWPIVLNLGHLPLSSCQKPSRFFYLTKHNIPLLHFAISALYIFFSLLSQKSPYSSLLFARYCSSHYSLLYVSTSLIFISCLLLSLSFMHLAHLLHFSLYFCFEIVSAVWLDSSIDYMIIV